MAAGSEEQARSKSERFWSFLELEGVSQAYFSLSTLCNEPEEIPSRTNLLLKPDQPFIEKFCGGVHRSGGTAPGTASSLQKEDPHGAGAGGVSHPFHAQASPGKGLSNQTGQELFAT